MKEQTAAKGLRLWLFFMAIDLCGRFCVLGITNVHSFDIAVRYYLH